MMKQFSAGSFISGLLLGFVVCSVWFFIGTNIMRSLAPETVSPEEEVEYPHTHAGLSVSDQPAGSEVIIDNVTVPDATVWIAIREMQGDQLGNVLGAARVRTPRVTVSVPLLRDTDPNRLYAVELYRDGDDGVFDHNAQSVYVDFDTGLPVIVYFNTTS